MTDEPPGEDGTDGLEDASDGDLMRVVYGLDAGESGPSLGNRARAVLELRERGYAVDGTLADVEVRDSEGTVLEPEDVEDYQGGG